jgi:hypothetical protein
MGFLDVFKRKMKVAEATSEPADPLFSKVAAIYPSGPVRRGSLKNIPRHLDLTGKGPVIDEITIFDGRDHWFCLFLGCRALGLPFEISLRTGKSTGETSPPDWFVEPVTRVANAIGDGAKCAPGVTWVIGSPLAGPASTYTGFLTLPDLEFGNLEPQGVLQLVPVSQAELGLHGNELDQLCDRLQGDRSRMTGVTQAPKQ